MEMTKLQRETVEMIQGTLPSFLAYHNPSGEDTDVLLLDPTQPLSIIAVAPDGATNEFDGSEWQTGWSA